MPVPAEEPVGAVPARRHATPRPGPHARVRQKDTPPRYAEPSDCTGSAMSAWSSSRVAAPPSNFHLPSFHGQNSSRTSKTIAPSSWYVRPDSASPMSTSRTQSECPCHSASAVASRAAGRGRDRAGAGTPSRSPSSRSPAGRPRDHVRRSASRPVLRQCEAPRLWSPPPSRLVPVRGIAADVPVTFVDDPAASGRRPHAAPRGR